MFQKRVLRRSFSIVLIAVLFYLSAVLSSCAPQSPLPEDAKDALIAYWESLPSNSTIDHRIIRSWPGAKIADEPGLVPSSREIWCVETEIFFAEEQSIVGEHVTWIVFRDDENEAWSATMLAVMSSMWPYEACQQGFQN